MSSYARMLTLAAAIGVILVCGSAAHSQDDAAPKATKITTETPGIGDLSHALNIKKIVGSYHLSEKVANVHLKLLFYHNGELVKLPNTGWTGIDYRVGADSGEFALQIVDLDYLSIRDAKPDSHRLHILLSLGIVRTSYKIDIPKSTFDVTRAFHVLSFSAKNGKANEALLFAIIGGKGVKIRGTSLITVENTPDAFVKANPKADILIAVLEFEK